ncbi:hypothetical protein F8A10_12185 [Paracoccus kondratievae]|uniref:hypothetical protein n=1 Tax=Paracoccus kondratievae TaxID=135740 RepID=UPI0012665672|nr:hypothetical protein [Paracoccus kondratievae]QFQ88269.1 hypothetical protein F8A10_12185 [Paracoccus kondratievae]
MAEGMTRPEAMTMARTMVGEGEVSNVLLPASDHDLIRLILASNNRWLRASAGLGPSIPIGLDLPAVDVTARWLGINPDARLLDGLMILEREALKLMRTER